MRKLVWSIAAFLLLTAMPAGAQTKKQTNRKPVAEKTTISTIALPPVAKKYPSLLWEISGHGLSKPSYLFGTMHVSDKMVFHLGDSFYNAIKSAEVVALETNPETWQDDYSNSVFFKSRNGRKDLSQYASRNERPNDNLRITSFSIDTYEEIVKAALAMEPSMINGMLYRTYGTRMDDFEEDTFLDMYIFQTGKKLGKRLSGVENFQASEKLVMEAYRDMVKDKNKRKKSYDYEGSMTNPKKLEDAYRKGDLDLLDSLENLSVTSDAFQEKFLYKRNEIQAESIDSIIRKSTLFVGVGAAHLPGKRGVIEMLRQMGYTLRPVSLDERNGVQKDAIDKIKFSNTFVSQTSDDGMFKVSVPGKKFYRFTDWSGLDVVQYADLVNGAYYLVTRIKTNSLTWGHNADVVYRKIDSLLYENIPGKIIKKTPVTRNGYKGLDITNKTRRGDIQRYQLFITPFEVIIFKMSGNNEFVTTSDDAQQFFNSVQLKEYGAETWQTWQPATGGFSVAMPHAPSLLRDNGFGTDRLEYAAWDQKDGNNYLVMNLNLHNYNFLEEDTFELNLVQESYAYSPFIEKQLTHKFIKVGGYPALESTFKHKDGSYSAARFILRGPVYYAAIAHYKNDNANARRFLESFAITPFVYPAATLYTDTTMRLTVTSPVYEGKKEASQGIEDLLRASMMDMEDGDDADNGTEATFASKLIGNDTIGEKIFVNMYRTPSHYFQLDSLEVLKDRERKDSDFVYKVDKQYMLPGGIECREMQLTDTGSSKTLLIKYFYKNGNSLSICALTDTLGTRSAFLEKFFGTCTPTDTLNGPSPFTRKTKQFVQDLFSKDSVISRRAYKSLNDISFDSLDVPLVKQVIDSLNWDMRDYIDTKKFFIASLGTLKDTSITTYLQQLYWKIKDTSDFQNEILNALLSQQTKGAFIAFKDLVLQDPPIVEEESSSNYRYYYNSAGRPRIYGNARRKVIAPMKDVSYYMSGRGWRGLYDSLALTKVIFPDILQLLTVDDYKENIIYLLQTMVDSNYLQAKDYETYFSKLYLDAKHLLKKQRAAEDKSRIAKAGKKEDNDEYYDILRRSSAGDNDNGNSKLDVYAILLLPFREKNPGVQNFFEQLMQTQDERLLYNTSMLLMRNNVPVADSILVRFAKKESYRSELYAALKEMNKLDKFPAAWKGQPEIVKSILSNSMRNYDKLDTVIFLDKLPVTYKNKKGYVYFYKYKQMRDDNTWQVAAIGMQPENVNETDLENEDFVSMDKALKLELNKPVKEQLQKMLKEMLYSKRPSAAEFYDARSLALYKNYLSEMVKNKRYQD
ncbi:MAG: TraB/GumN family protein [Chitinophagaceae bacterium]